MAEKKFWVYATRTVEVSTLVHAETEDEAREIAESGDVDWDVIDGAGEEIFEVTEAK